MEALEGEPGGEIGSGLSTDVSLWTSISSSGTGSDGFTSAENSSNSIIHSETFCKILNICDRSSAPSVFAYIICISQREELEKE